jgi:hypothetical protein
MANDDLRKSLAEIKERTRQARLERGQLPEAPEDFLSVPLSIALAERLTPFKGIAAKYAGIIAEGRLIPVDTSKFESFRKDIALLDMSIGFHCGVIASGCGIVLSMMETINSAIEAGATEPDTDMIRRLHFALSLMRKSPSDDAYDYKSDVSAPEQNRIVHAEVERLKANPIALEAELAAAWAHYETIKHEI